jgi:hypothetical protein
MARVRAPALLKEPGARIQEPGGLGHLFVSRAGEPISEKVITRNQGIKDPGLPGSRILDSGSSKRTGARRSELHQRLHRYIAKMFPAIEVG